MRPYLFLICLLWAGFSSASNVYGSVTVLYIVDGDTVDISFNSWLDQTTKTRVRVSPADTPEKRGKGVPDCEKVLALEATRFTEQFLSSGDVSFVFYGEAGGFGRPLGDFVVNGISLSDSLIAAGHAREYRPSDKRIWCVD